MPTIFRKKTKDGKEFCRIDPKKKRGHYTILPESKQHKVCRKVTLVGFTKLPSGFYTNNGYGLTSGGFALLRELSNAYRKKRVSLTLKAAGKPRITVSKQVVKATIPHPKLAQLNADVRQIKQHRNAETKASVHRFLWSQFPTRFKRYKAASAEYAPGDLAQTFAQDDLLARLNSEDRHSLEDFIPEYLGSVQGTLKSKSKLKVVYDSLDASKKVYLSQVVSEFKRKLESKTKSEAAWQKFLSGTILVLRNTYSHVLEKQSVSLQGKFPDFMLVDPYGYIDVYEIKKPTTTLMSHDESRNNYYWHSELSKAISQAENYLHQLLRNRDAFINDVRQSKGIDINIVRPRGYIIAGRRKELKKGKMLDDFRILNESLKNIDVVLYDDLLNSLEAFLAQISTNGD